MGGNCSRRARVLLAVVLAALLALGAAACQEKGGGSNPFAPCPHGWNRVRDVTKPPMQQWVCER